MYKKYVVSLNKRDRIGIFLEIAKSVAKLSTCLSRKTGAVIINPETHNIISYGYNGAPTKVSSCNETGKCFRKSSKSGHSLNLCIATHAEVNAIINAAKTGQSPINKTIMIATDKPCLNCLKACVNAGLSKIYFDNNYTIPKEENLIYNKIVNESKIELIEIIS